MGIQADGDRVRQLRLKKGWGVEDLAEKAGCSKKTVENVEAGKPALIRTLGEIATALGVEAGDLFAQSNPDAVDGQQAQAPVAPLLLGSVPPVPSLVIGRDRALRDVKQRLTRPSWVDESHRVVAVHGWAGVGKSTIAAALAHDSDMASVFRDGVLWVSLGREPDILKELGNWGRSLGTETVQRAASVQQASGQIGAILREKQMFLIIDDAWSVEDFIPFRVGGRSCATLVTTRLNSVADRLSPTPEDSYDLEVLDEESALDLLKRLAPAVVEKYPADSRSLVQALEGLPLAIEVAGRLLSVQHKRWESGGASPVGGLLSELKDTARVLQEEAPASMASLMEETIPTVAAVLKKSTDCLDDETCERFAHLGAFVPKPATFGLDYMALKWNVDEAEAQRIADKLIDHGLLKPVGKGRFWIHALLVSLAKTLWT